MSKLRFKPSGTRRSMAMQITELSELRSPSPPVLSEKVADGYMDEDEAIALAGKVLRDNPAELFKLAV